MGDLLRSITAAIDGNDEASLQSLLSKSGAASTTNVVSDEGYTILYRACMRKCSPAMVRLVLKLGPTIDLKGEDKETPLFIATHNNLDDVVQMLISAGANVNELNGVDGDTALHAAARYGFASTAKILFEAGANLNMRNARLETPLFASAKAGKHEVVYQLLQWDANKNLSNEDGKNPLFIASERGHKHVVEILKVDKSHLKDAKAQADVELRMRQSSISSTEQLSASLKSKPKEPEEEPVKKSEPLPITKIEIPETKERTHDPLTGKAYGPCKTLEQVGPDKPAEIPAEAMPKPLKEEFYGGTSMAVGTGTGMKFKQRELVSHIPGDGFDFSTSKEYTAGRRK